MKIKNGLIILSIIINLCTFIPHLNSAYPTKIDQIIDVIDQLKQAIPSAKSIPAQTHLINVIELIDQLKKTKLFMQPAPSKQPHELSEKELYDKAVHHFKNEFLDAYDKAKTQPQDPKKNEIVIIKEIINQLQIDQKIKNEMLFLASSPQWISLFMQSLRPQSSRPAPENINQPKPVMPSTKSMPAPQQLQQTTISPQEKNVHDEALRVFNNEFLTVYDQGKNDPAKVKRGLHSFFADIIDSLKIDDPVKSEMKKMLNDPFWLRNFITNHDVIQTLKNSNKPEIDKKLYPELYKFLEKYYCPKNVDTLFKKRLTKSNPPLINFQRVINAVRMKNYLKSQLPLLNLKVANKCLTFLNDRWILTAEEVNTDSNPLQLTLEEVKELAQFAQDTGFTDWGQAHRRNILRDVQTQTIVFIDTEDRSFVTNRGEDKAKHNIPYQCKHRYLSLLQEALGQNMTIEGQTWLDNQIKTLKDPYKVTPSIPYNSTYDDPGINFEQVKQELETMLENIRIDSIKKLN